MEKKRNSFFKKRNSKSALPQTPALESQKEQLQLAERKYVFLSYSRKDLEFVNYLRTILEQQHGMPIWMDQQYLTPGMNWSNELEKAVNDCSAVVVVMTPASQESTFVQTEILHALDQKKPIFPVLLIGSSPFFLLKSKQFEDMRDGLSATPSPEFIRNLNVALGLDAKTEETKHEIQFDIVKSDVREFECDVLILKHAKAFYGADQLVRNIFKDHAWSRDIEILRAGQHIFLDETSNRICAKNVLFVPTVGLGQFNYSSIRKLVQDAFTILLEKKDRKVEHNGEKLHIAMTMHGVKQGLDENHSLNHQLQGLMDALTSLPNGLNTIGRISIIDRDLSTTERLNSLAAVYFETKKIDWNDSLLALPSTKVVENETCPGEIEDKSYALTLTSKDALTGDMFYYGIQQPVHAMGLLCESMEISSFSLKDEETILKVQRIQRSKVIIIDADCIPTNQKKIIYLLIGCALGASVPICLITKNESDDLECHSDWCIRYTSIKELSDQLRTWLKKFKISTWV